MGRIHVVAGIVEDAHGRVLVAERPVGSSKAGFWEFPGGKLTTGESRFTGLVREFTEELGIFVSGARPLIRYLHHQEEFGIDLDIWRVTEWTGQPRGIEGQRIGWYLPQELPDIGLLPADTPVLSALSLPALVAITPSQPPGGLEQLCDQAEEIALRREGGILVLRLTGFAHVSALEVASTMAYRLEGSTFRVLLHGDPHTVGRDLTSPPEPFLPRLSEVVAGLHSPARFVMKLEERPLPRSFLFGVSCHDATELSKALRVGADYAFLGPVKETASHPGQPGMGWEGFEALVRELPLPVYAIGGLGPEDLETAWQHGAQGIAAIRSLWPG